MTCQILAHPSPKLDHLQSSNFNMCASRLKRTLPHASCRKKSYVEQVFLTNFGFCTRNSEGVMCCHLSAALVAHWAGSGCNDAAIISTTAPDTAGSLQSPHIDPRSIVCIPLYPKRCPAAPLFLDGQVGRVLAVIGARCPSCTPPSCCPTCQPRGSRTSSRHVS